MPDSENDLERLLSEAELGAAATAPTVATPMGASSALPYQSKTTVSPCDGLRQATIGSQPLSVAEGCKHCHVATTSVCPTCHGPFCPDHASILDDKYCNVCLNEPMAELKVVTPLKDADGVSHNGRELIPTGPVFGTTAKKICEMSQYELDGFVTHYRELIRQAELALDFRRTMLGMGQLEQSQRKDAERRRLRGVRVRIPGVLNPLADKATASVSGVPTKQRSSTSKSSPIFDQMMKAVEMLREMQKAKGYAVPQSQSSGEAAKPPDVAKPQTSVLGTSAPAAHTAPVSTTASATPIPVRTIRRPNGGSK